MKNPLPRLYNACSFFGNMAMPNDARRWKTLTLSVLLHAAMLFAISFAHFSIVPGLPTSAENEDLQIILPNAEFYTDKSNSDLDFDGDAESYPSPVESRGEQRGLNESESDDFVAETDNLKEEVMMASLASLSELKESISFGLSEISANSRGDFTPIQGSLPDTDYLANGSDGYGFGLKRGLRIRASSGGGNCPRRSSPSDSTEASP